MHLSNFIYLTKRLHNAGFGDELNELLKTRLQDQPSRFELPFKACFNKQILNISVFVKKWREQDASRLNMYYIYKYHAALSRENNIDLVEQDFYLGNYSPSVTIQEAYNLLSGRAVFKTNLTNKENVSFKAWVQLDFTQKNARGNFKWQYYRESYGYDLAAELAKYPIPLLAIPGATEHLLGALQHGYREEVAILVDGSEERFYLEAQPQFKSLAIYDVEENPLLNAEKADLMTKPKKEADTPSNNITAVDADLDDEAAGDPIDEPLLHPKKKRTVVR